MIYRANSAADKAQHIESIVERVQAIQLMMRLAHDMKILPRRHYGLSEQWNFRKGSRPFIVGFLYAYSFPRRPTMKELIDNAVIRDVNSAPRGFESITAAQFSKILELARADSRFIVD
jgi:hypothetical protein